MKKKITIVIPIYCEARNINFLFKELNSETKKLTNYLWTFIFVNDGSHDDSIIILKKLSNKYKFVKIIEFSKNFGKEIALTAGVHHAQNSDAVICIDADLQHPPSLIPQLIKKWENGSEIVVAIRSSSENNPIIRKIGSKVFYWVMSYISQTTFIPNSTDYRIFDKKVVSAFSLATERQRIFRGIIDWMGFKKDFVEFSAKQRIEGKQRYLYKNLLKLALDSFTSFSLFPLKAIGFLGLIITFISSGILIWNLVYWSLHNELLHTFLGIALIFNTFGLGVILIAIGLVAMYIGNIHTEVINRPLYIIREKTNFLEKN